MPIEIADFIQEKGLENDLDGLLIDPNDLKIKKQIGSGGFATVYRYYNKKFLIKNIDFVFLLFRGSLYGTKVAIKMIDHTKFDSKIFEDFLREVNLLKKIRHPHIVFIIFDLF